MEEINLKEIIGKRVWVVGSTQTPHTISLLLLDEDNGVLYVMVLDSVCEGGVCKPICVVFPMRGVVKQYASNKDRGVQE